MNDNESTADTIDPKHPPEPERLPVTTGGHVDAELVAALRRLGNAIVRLADISVKTDERMREEFEPTIRGMHHEVSAALKSLQSSYDSFNETVRDNSRATRENAATTAHFAALVEDVLAREKARGERVGEMDRKFQGALAELEGKVILAHSKIETLSRAIE